MKIKQYLIIYFLLAGWIVASAHGAEVNDFSLFAKERITLGADTQVLAGALGSNAVAPNAIEFKRNASTAAGVTITADHVKLGVEAFVGDVFSNTLDAHDTASTGQRNTLASTPVVAKVPDLPPVAIGNEDSSVARSAVTTVSPGSYRNIVVAQNAVVTFAAGDYFLDALSISEDVVVKFTGPTTLNIGSMLKLGIGSVFNAEAPAQAVTINFSGTTRIEIADYSALQAERIHAPNAEVAVGKEALFKGVMHARIIDIGNGALVDVPDLSGPVTAAAPPGGTSTAPIEVALGANEPGDIFYTTDGSEPTTSSSVYKAPIPLESDTVLKYFAVDLSGNMETPYHTERYIIDGDAPVIKITGVSDGESNEQNKTPVITITDTHTLTSSITLNSAPFASGTAITEQGNYVLEVNATDTADNSSKEIVRFTIDRTPPAVTIAGVRNGTKTNQSVTPVITVTEANLLDTTITLNGRPFNSGTTINTDDNYVLEVVAVDTAEHQSTATVSFNIDTTAPVIAISGVRDGEFSNDNVTPTIAIADANPVPEQNVITLDGKPFTPGRTLTAEGDYKLFVSAKDQLGQSASATIQFAIDRTKPGIRITGAEDGKFTNKNVTPRIVITDKNVAPGAKVTLNGQTFRSDTTIAEEGRYQLMVAARDLANNAETATVNFEIDKTAPAIGISGVRNGQVTNRDVPLAITIADTNPGSQSITVDGKPFGWGGTVSAEGNHTVAVSATDAAGNESKANRSFSIDKTAPVIAISGVKDGDIAKQAVPFAVAINDANPGSQSVTLNGRPFQPGRPIDTDGKYTVVVDATDKAGNKAFDRATFVIDQTAPMITALTTLDGDTTIDPFVPVKATFVDTMSGIAVTSVALKLDGVDVTASATITANNLTFTPTTPLADGEHTVRLVIADLAGHTVEKTTKFTVTEPEEEPPAAAISGTAELDATGTLSDNDIQPTIDTIVDEVIFHSLAAGDAIGLPKDSFPITHVPPVVIGSRDESIARNATVTVSPASFRHVDMGRNAVVTFEPGDYFLDTLTARRGTVVKFTGPTTLNIRSAIDFAKGVAFNSQSPPQMVTVNFSGDGSIKIANNNIIQVKQFNAPKATVNVGRNSLFKGVMYANIIDLDKGVVGTRLDTTAPVTAVSAAGGMYHTPIDVTLSTNEPASIFYTTDGTQPSRSSTLFEKPISIKADTVLKFFAVDVAGNAETSIHTESYIVDGAAPLIRITGVNDGEANDKDKTPVITITDTHTFTSSITLNGVAFVSGTPITQEGSYELDIQATDIADNNANTTVHFTIDRTPPAVAITGVENGALLNHSVTPVVAITEANVGTTTITLNGRPFTSGTTIGDDGNYRLEAIAVDTAGYQGTAAMNFSIDKTAPSITISGVSDGEFNNDDVLPTVSIWDAHPVPGNNIMTLDGKPFTSGTRLTTEGDYELIVSATDQLGQHSHVSYKFAIDRTEPIIRVTGVKGGDVTRHQVTPRIVINDKNTAPGSEITLNGEPFKSNTTITQEGRYELVVAAADLANNRERVALNFVIDKTAPAIAISGVRDRVVTKQAVSPAITIAEANPSAQTITLNGKPFGWGSAIADEGRYTLAVDATDAAENNAKASLSFLIDKTAPVILGLTALDGSETEDPFVPMRARFTDALSGINVAGVLLELDGVNVTKSSTVTPTSVDFVPKKKLADGVHSIRLVVTDVAGHTTEQINQFTVTTPPPVVVEEKVSADGSTEEESANEESPWR